MRGLPRLQTDRAQLAVLLVHAVMTQVLTFILRPTTAYRALELDMATPLLGVLAASFAVVPLLLAVPSGSAVDRLGERRVMVAGSLLLLLSCTGFVVLGGGLAGLVVIVAFGGADTIPQTQRIFVGATVLSALLLGCTFLLLARTRHAVETAAPRALRSLLQLLGLARALLTSCVVLAAVDITLVYLPALGADRGLPSGVVGALLALRAVASMASRSAWGGSPPCWGVDACCWAASPLRPRRWGQRQSRCPCRHCPSW